MFVTCSGRLAFRWTARESRGKIEGMGLREYRRKRNFKATPEPAGKSPRAGRRRSTDLAFVIQKHAASHLHYDFRLEIDGTLKSWAVPKRPPYKQSEKRLAMPTEDHPLEYLDFEGVIPKGQHGGGTVMVWDIGTYQLMEGNYDSGYLHFYLSGRKLKGEWLLYQGQQGGNRLMWFLDKITTAMRPLANKKDDESALTGRSIEE